MLCWFCKDAMLHAEAGTALAVPLYRVLSLYDGSYGAGRYGTKHFKYESRTVRIPRCRRCKGAHNASSLLGVFMLVVAIVLAYKACSAGGEPGSAGWLALAVAVFVVVSGVGIGLGRLLERLCHTEAEECKELFPEIQMLKESGWKIGEEPTFSDTGPRK